MRSHQSDSSRVRPEARACAVELDWPCRINLVPPSAVARPTFPRCEGYPRHLHLAAADRLAAPLVLRSSKELPHQFPTIQVKRMEGTAQPVPYYQSEVHGRNCPTSPLLSKCSAWKELPNQSPIIQSPSPHLTSPGHWLYLVILTITSPHLTSSGHWLYLVILTITSPHLTSSGHLLYLVILTISSPHRDVERASMERMYYSTGEGVLRAIFVTRHVFTARIAEHDVNAGRCPGKSALIGHLPGRPVQWEVGSRWRIYLLFMSEVARVR
uniref:Uncharacterized protein n=1 Tax=Timema monikensis TaxID=170555 RepID=A0A7R9HL88_9NEOP|nr:unnamed protein product [Timema monikensis]